MKKIFLGLLSIFLLAGCGQSQNAINEFKNKVEKSKSYTIKGTLELTSDEEVFNYNIEVDYLKDNYYKVDMVNTQNDHEQVILRNDEGLYVITPSLNKSFKFESTWPDNSSQSYILSSIVKDINNDKDATVEQNGDMFVIKSKVDYPNNSELTYQKVYLDNEYNVKKLEVYSDSNLVKITVVFNEVDLNASHKKDEFKIEDYVQEKTCEGETCEQDVMSKIESAIYPLYMPSNTYLTSSEVIDNEEDARVILTFTGEKNFTLVEETATINAEHEIIPVFGEPLMLYDTIAALSSNSMYWTSNNVDYYIVSEDLSVGEMKNIATSLSNARATIATK